MDKEPIILLKTFQYVYESGQLPYAIRAGCVRVDVSPIHGNGVFANSRIECGEAFAYYPATHGIFYEVGNQKGLMYDYDVTVGRVEHRNFFMSVANFAGCSLVANPKAPIRDGWLGHMMNDSRIVPKPLEARACIEYLVRAPKETNCVSINLECGMVLFVATQTIEAGQEVLFPYGFGYGVDEFDVKRLVSRLSPREALVYERALLQYEAHFQSTKTAFLNANKKGLEIDMFVSHIARATPEERKQMFSAWKASTSARKR